MSNDSDRAWLKLNGARARLHSAVGRWQREEVGVSLPTDVASRLHEANAAERVWDQAAVEAEADESEAQAEAEPAPWEPPGE
jgi:hypothetical protein